MHIVWFDVSPWFWLKKINLTNLTAFLKMEMLNFDITIPNNFKILQLNLKLASHKQCALINTNV